MRLAKKTTRRRTSRMRQKLQERVSGTLMDQRYVCNLSTNSSSLTVKHRLTLLTIQCQLTLKPSYPNGKGSHSKVNLLQSWSLYTLVTYIEPSTRRTSKGRHNSACTFIHARWRTPNREHRIGWCAECPSIVEARRTF